MATNHTEDGLKKLTVSQLKNICKEKQIKGYSKLAKPLLVQKILDHHSAQHTQSASTNNAIPDIFGGKQPPDASIAAVSPSSLAPIIPLNVPSASSTRTKSSSSLMPVTNVTQSTTTPAHIIASAPENGLKRLNPTDFTASDSLPPSKKAKTTASSIVSSPLVSSKRPITPSFCNSTVELKKLKIGNAVATPTVGSNPSLTAAQAQRKKTLEEDPLATNVLHCSVTCKACGKLVKYTMFDLYHWNRHKTRCKPDLALSQSSSISTSFSDEGSAHMADLTLDMDLVSRASTSAGGGSSLTAAQAQRKKALEEDLLASNVQLNSVTCKACGNVVRYSMFSLYHWNEHKTRCQGNPSRSASASSKENIAYDTVINSLENSPSAAPPSQTAIFTHSIGDVRSPLSAAQAESKKALEKDPLATNIQRSSVNCRARRKLVKFGNFTNTKGKRFTPLIINKEALPAKTPNPSLTEVPLSASATSVTAPIPSTFKAPVLPKVPFPESTTNPLVPISAVPPHLKFLQEDTFAPIIQKNSSVPEITLEVNSKPSLSLYHLDFPMPVPLTLESISFPPVLAQRKQVARFAIILSQVTMKDLSRCMLVSRMFRYAVYLSASTRLARNFAGHRFNRIFHRLPINTINMWPYLLQREGETKYRRRVYEESFLGRVFKGRTLIAPHLWTSPDNDKQLAVAVRFLMTRLFFTVSVGGGKNGDGWLDGMIVDAREIVKGEIWSIDIVHPTENIVESFYVLESTCEVVGLAPLPSKAEGPAPVQMRADWSAYIKQRLSTQSALSQPKLDPSRSSSSIPTTSLLDQVSWTNHEEFTKGISKLWLKRVEDQQGVGATKRIVAERYILASVVGNSVSGQYMTSTEMASDFAGAPIGVVGSVKRAPAKLNMFLPAPHHVESVHFTTAKDHPLHPALAIIHTPAREYFVLRDNGMQVGCEEDGVADVWMNIIGCANNGERA